MKHLFYTSAVILAFLFVSCNGNTSSNSAEKNSAAVSQDTVNAQNIDSTKSNNIDANTTLESKKTPLNQEITNNNNQTNNEAGKAKTPVKPETPTDKLLKQYNEAMGALIDASKNGSKPSEEATQKFMDLQTQLEELDNSGKLSTTQKELFKVTKDAYNMLKSKQ
jgi:hypothetical protein